MRIPIRKYTVILLAALLMQQQLPGRPAPTQKAEKPQLAQLVNQRYLDLLGLAPALNFTAREIDEFKRRLEQEKDAEKKRLEEEEKAMKAQIEATHKALDRLNKQSSRDTAEMAEERRKLQCQVYKFERQIAEKRTEREHGLPLAYDNKRAKLDLIQLWPAKKKEIAETVASGRARARKHGDVEDIGVRKVGEGQEKDVKLGQDAINEMKAYGLLLPEIEDKEIKEYAHKLADAIAVNSDLIVPVKVFVMESEEINAFALPGGYLFLNTGLIEKAENESELAGVIAHELAHVTARHGAKLMKRAAIAGIIYQVAQVAAMIATGGVVGVGTYYALQYGFFGLGLALDLALLGVSREYEAEADQLGVQYAWRAGYDPHGFITLFDRMASEEGHVRSASFFRTHPPFFDRIVSTFSEIEYLPEKQNLQVDSTAFQKTKERLKKLKQEGESGGKKRPTLKRMPQCEDDEEKKKPLALNND
jgi:hypothetical protein